MRRLVLVIVTVLAAVGGLLMTAANRWGAGAPAPCRDMVVQVIAACLAPQSPVWALALGALLPACAVATLGVIWLRWSRGD